MDNNISAAQYLTFKRRAMKHKAVDFAYVLSKEFT